MALIDEIKKVINQKGISESDLYLLTKTVLLNYKRSNEERLTYNLIYTDDIPNRFRLSREIKVKGCSIRSVEGRINNAISTGFKPDKENKELTSQICTLLDLTREELVVKFKQD